MSYAQIRLTALRPASPQSSRNHPAGLFALLFRRSVVTGYVRPTYGCYVDFYYCSLLKNLCSFFSGGNWTTIEQLIEGLRGKVPGWPVPLSDDASGGGGGGGGGGSKPAACKTSGASLSGGASGNPVHGPMTKDAVRSVTLGFGPAYNSPILSDQVFALEMDMRASTARFFGGGYRGTE